MNYNLQRIEKGNESFKNEVLKNTKNLSLGFVLGYGTSKLSMIEGGEHFEEAAVAFGNMATITGRNLKNMVKYDMTPTQAAYEGVGSDLSVIIGTVAGYGYGKLEDIVLPFIANSNN